MGSIFDQTSILPCKWNVEKIIMQKNGGWGEESKGGRVCGERLFLICVWVEVPSYFNFSIKQQLTVGKVEASVQPVVPGLLSSLVSWTGVEGWERACTHHVVADFSHGVRSAVVVITSPHSCLSMFKARGSPLALNLNYSITTRAPNGKNS